MAHANSDSEHLARLLKLRQNVSTSRPQSIERRIVVQPNAQGGDRLAVGGRPVGDSGQLGVQRASPATPIGRATQRAQQPFGGGDRFLTAAGHPKSPSEWP